MSIRLHTSTKAALVVLAGLMAAPVVVHAQDHYDGYCYMRKHDARTDGAVIGAVAGGALGGTVANTHNKGVGTVLGAAVGAAVGANIGADSVKCYNGEYHSFDRGAYNPPAPPEGYEAVYYHTRPDATYYSRVEYQTRTTTTYDNGSGYYSQSQTYSTQPAYSQPAYGQPVYSTSPDYAPPPPPPPAQPAYSDDTRPDYGVQGFRDEDGYWHRGQPRAIGWQDENGTWHEGRVVAYGWRDSNGHWHEDHSQDQQPGNGY